MADLSALFTPFTLGQLYLPNRIVMAPMTRQRSPGGVPGADVAHYYARRAAGGVGLILTEGVTIDDPAASPAAEIPGFHGPALDGWSEVLAAVHAAGGRIMPQLWHLGVVRRANASPRPDAPSVSPSGLLRPGKPVGEPMSEARILQIIDAFARGARDAQRLGFDGVELHGAHGYLIDQFFWEGTNVRTDRWGGDMPRRGLFAAEIVRAVRAATSPDFPVIMRWSQWKTGEYGIKLAADSKALEAFLAPLVDAGVTAFHCSTRRFWEPEFLESGSDLNLAGWTKRVSGLPTITVGSVGLNRADSLEDRRATVGSDTRRLAQLSTMLERGDFDLVAIGRALLANPEWPQLVRERRFDDLVAFGSAALDELV
jgi:2,4-dienoyl-CoA reductase-like NADH-dependent reductase (Old Yellow Enzyme family)